MVLGVRVLSWFSFRKGGFALESTTYSSLKGSEISHAVIPLKCPNGPFLLHSSLSISHICLCTVSLCCGLPSHSFCTAAHSADTPCHSLANHAALSAVRRLNSSAGTMQEHGKPVWSPCQTAAKHWSKELVRVGEITLGWTRASLQTQNQILIGLGEAAS